MIRKLEVEERQTNKANASAEKATIKDIVQAAKDALREGEHEIAEAIAEKQYELDEKKQIEEEDKASMTLLKNAPMWLQD